MTSLVSLSMTGLSTSAISGCASSTAERMDTDTLYLGKKLRSSSSAVNLSEPGSGRRW